MPLIAKTPSRLRTISLSLLTLFIAVLCDPQTAVAEKKSKRKRPLKAWPTPVALVKNIEPLLEIAETAPWAQQTLTLIDLLTSCESVGDDQNGPIFLQLQRQANELDELSMQVSVRPANHPSLAIGPVAVQLRRLQYQLSRRLAIWIPLYEIARQGPMDRDASEELSAELASSKRIRFESIEPVWRDYLLIDETEAAFNQLNSTEKERKDAARRLLARIHSPALSAQQSEFVREAINAQAIEFFQQVASKPVDYSRLLRDLERHEYAESGVSQVYFNDSYQNLLWSTDERHRQLAETIDTHYRNANFRVTISEKLINRLIPTIPESSEPISDNMLGAQIYGQTHIRNQLRIGLIPDPERIHLQLESLGSADISTTAVKSGFAVQNQGFSRFQVFKKLAISRHGVFSDRARAFSESSNRLVNIRSKLDRIPVVGNVARRVARNQIEAQKPMADSLSKKKLEQSVEERMQEEVETQINEMRQVVARNLINPLVALEVEPEPVQMTTTKERIVVRYRLAGRDQMAANTSRPRAWPGSQLSLQIHHSAVNNFLDRIGLAGNEFTPASLTTHLRQSMGLPPQPPEDEEDATIQFSNIRPISVTFEEGKFEIELNLKSLKIGKKTWKNLKVRSAYAPSVSGANVMLLKDGEVSLGRRLRFGDEVIVRAIFSCVFEDQYHFNPFPDSLAKPMKSPDLSIAHLVIDNGWIGISLVDSPKVAERPQ